MLGGRQDPRASVARVSSGGRLARKPPPVQRTGGAFRWVALIFLVAVAALAACWAMRPERPAPPPPEVPQAPAAEPPTAAKEVAPLRTAAWMLAHSRPAPAPQPQKTNPQNEDWACGASGAVCPDDAVCIDGGCLSSICAAGDSASSCALSSGRAGGCCGGRCSDLDEDAANCGQCGASCLQGLDCISGRCLARSCAGKMAGTLCSGGGKGGGACCRDRCIDQSTWASDSANCGGCGHACAPGLVCKQASCVDAVTGEPPAWTCLQPGHTCAEDSFCVIDGCYPRDCRGDTEGLLCLAPSGGKLVGHCCGTFCADLFADRTNCRACGVHCAPGEVCRNGDCMAPER
jgi:hypothetical protein